MSTDGTDFATIEIDADLCGGLGECVDLAPDMVEMGDDGIARVTVATGDFTRLQKIAHSCPLAAITVMRSQQHGAA